MNATATIQRKVENGHFPTQHIAPTRDDWFVDKFVIELREIDGQFNVNALNVYVTSPRTGNEVLFQKVRKIEDAGDVVAWVWKEFQTRAELHIYRV